MTKSLVVRNTHRTIYRLDYHKLRESNEPVYLKYISSDMSRHRSDEDKMRIIKI